MHRGDDWRIYKDAEAIKERIYEIKRRRVKTGKIKRAYEIK